MATRQRLILCFDGTWNKEDSSTNVLHQSNLLVEGPVGEFVQKRFYQRGVGTGVLDRISGGAFGGGLEENVRAGYNWLVENFQDGADPDHADEIYIFGFSRGAFTARSLVGFIGRCGLLHRGAPLPVEQLWRAYCLLGREREQRKSGWDYLFRNTPTGMRQITDLVLDPWDIDPLREVPAGEVPGQVRERSPAKSAQQRETEQLLVRWSRRAKITYLGVYDTVGSLGLDALAFPALKSKIALHHNLNPTELIQRCRHALAIDENRSNFSHTPFLAYLGNKTDAKRPWDRKLAMWNDRIEQRWFAGAHSNVGGGYPNNRLSEAPLAWIFEGGREAGLVCEPLRETPQVDRPLPPPVDSFADFAKPLWTDLLRAKRNYRAIDPEPERRAALRNQGTTPGFSLWPINESVHPSALEYYAGRIAPPNLYAWAVRKGTQTIARPPHVWLGEMRSAIMVVLWASLAAAGAEAFYKLVWPGAASMLPLWTTCAVAALLPFVDWAESRVNFSLACGWESAPAQAFLDAIYWTRAFGVAFFFWGLIFSTHYLMWLGTFSQVPEAGRFFDLHWKVPVAAAVSALIAAFVDRTSTRLGRLACGLALGVGAAFVLPTLALVMARGAHFLIPALTIHAPVEMRMDVCASLAGGLLLVGFAIFYLIKAVAWCKGPLLAANLPAVISLQLYVTPAAVTKRLEVWVAMLKSDWQSEDQNPPDEGARHAMRKILRQYLWRDIIGLIPVYGMAGALCLWFATNVVQEQQPWPLLGVPLWVWLPLAAMLPDFLEDTLHLRYLNLHEAGRQPQLWQTLVATMATALKFIAMAIGLWIIGRAVFFANKFVISEPLHGTRETLVLLLLTGLAITAVSLVVSWLVFQWLVGEQAD